ncbi:hypothetical protein [Streptacidiphilus rugosus]|uniref:hypothetical protein n=1 Tax=Streptacidiphilus rugosus TaxID=405783 RepID=UPI0012F76D9C|nr:hypothetical protein [Streptacidiphilus rugosus]
MTFELKAEYEFRAVLAWHVVPQGDSTSLCGTPLAPRAETRDVAALHRLSNRCRPCEILYTPRLGMWRAG